MPRLQVPSSSESSLSTGSKDDNKIKKPNHIRGLLGDQVLGVIAMAGCYFFYLALLPSVWVFGATFVTIGVLYLCLPFDVIPDSWRCVGWLDDLVIGGGCMALGAYLMYEAHKVLPFPLSQKLIPPAIVSLLIVLVAYIYEDIRKTLIGILAMVAVPCAAFPACSDAKLALGISLIGCGFLYTMLEIDLIPDEIPIIGKFDDIILGIVPIVVGIVIVVLAVKDGKIEVGLSAEL